MTVHSPINLIDLKERVAIADSFSPDEREFILRAINGTIEWQQTSRDFGALLQNMQKLAGDS